MVQDLIKKTKQFQKLWHSFDAGFRYATSLIIAYLLWPILQCKGLENYLGIVGYYYRSTCVRTSIPKFNEF